MTTITTNGAATASLQIYSTPPLNIAAGCKILSWSRRSTDKNPVPVAERYRGVVINEQEIRIPADACLSKFHMLLQSTIIGAAEAMLTDWLKEDGNIRASEYTGQALTMDNALMYWSEKKQREQIDAKQITDWLKESATFAELDEAKQKIWLAKVPKIAAPTYKGSFTRNEAAAIVARIADADTDHAIAQFVITRCNAIMMAEDQSDLL